jgi:hypothetical protein
MIDIDLPELVPRGHRTAMATRSTAVAVRTRGVVSIDMGKGRKVHGPRQITIVYRSLQTAANASQRTLITRTTMVGVLITLLLKL